MAASHDSPVCLAVLNPKGRDPYLDYIDGPAAHRKGKHAPVNFHAYAAATFGTFFDNVEELIKNCDRYDGVLVLIRRRAWITLAAVKQLKAAGIPVIVAWKECGDLQIAKQLRSWRARRAYRQIIEQADGVLSPASSAPPCPEGIDPDTFQAKLRLIPTPYPLEYADWNYSQAAEERNGVMIGTREFGTKSRNHLATLQRLGRLAADLNISRVTVINSEKKSGYQMLQLLKKDYPEDVLQIERKPLPYADYLKLLGSHRLVYQLDHGNVPGQVAGDCLLTHILCAGGNSAIEQIVFPELCDNGSRTESEVAAALKPLLNDDDAYQAALGRAGEIANERLSFTAVARELGNWNVLQ